MLCPWCFSKPCICTPDEAEARRNWTDDEYYEKSKAGWQRASAEIERLRAEIETLRVRVADQERFIATLESGIHEENVVVLQLRAEIAQLRADAELAEEVIVEDDAELLRLRLECNDLRAENERLRDGAEAYCPAGHPARYYAGIEAVRCSICGLVDVAADDSDIGRDHIR